MLFNTNRICRYRSTYNFSENLAVHLYSLLLTKQFHKILIALVVSHDLFLNCWCNFFSYWFNGCLDMRLIVISKIDAITCFNVCCFWGSERVWVYYILTIYEWYVWSNPLVAHFSALYKFRKSEQLLYEETKRVSNPLVAHFFGKSMTGQWGN